MLSEHAALPIDDGARTKRGGDAVAQESPVVVVGDEADLLALRLVGRHQAQRPRLVAHRFLRQLPHGEPRRGELLLGERPEEIRLVLVGITAAPEQVTSRGLVASDSRVVTRRHRGRVPGAGAMEQRAELDLAIADDAGHRGPARFVLAREVLDHRLIELALGVEQVVRDAEAARHLARVVHALGGAAAPELGGTAFAARARATRAGSRRSPRRPAPRGGRRPRTSPPLRSCRRRSARSWIHSPRSRGIARVADAIRACGAMSPRDERRARDVVERQRRALLIAAA